MSNVNYLIISMAIGANASRSDAFGVSLPFPCHAFDFCPVPRSSL